MSLESTRGALPGGDATEPSFDHSTEPFPRFIVILFKRPFECESLVSSLPRDNVRDNPLLFHPREIFIAPVRAVCMHAPARAQFCLWQKVLPEWRAVMRISICGVDTDNAEQTKHREVRNDDMELPRHKFQDCLSTVHECTIEEEGEWCAVSDIFQPSPRGHPAIQLSESAIEDGLIKPLDPAGPIGVVKFLVQEQPREALKLPKAEQRKRSEKRDHAIEFPLREVGRSTATARSLGHLRNNLADFLKH